MGESKLLGPLLATVGTVAIGWGVAARPEFGDLPTRLASLGQLLSHDRLGSSFVVDLGLFALFQGWLVDDDLRRLAGEQWQQQPCVSLECARVGDRCVEGESLGRQASARQVGIR